MKAVYLHCRQWSVDESMDSRLSRQGREVDIIEVGFMLKVIELNVSTPQSNTPRGEGDVHRSLEEMAKRRFLDLGVGLRFDVSRRTN